MSWAAEELKTASLGDKRRNQRLIKIVEDLSAMPIATYAIVAWRLLWLTYEARCHPTESIEGIEGILPPHYWIALYCHIHQTTILPQEPPSLADCVRWIARLGGFLGRKSDGEPGVKTLWLGLQRVHDMASIWQLLAPGNQ